ncbi:MFS transporter [Glutamicibacter sp. NPDC087344]|uniref:MFS transporter n=1 Tax=Glutamicibacter sp. NPDC087344 TaxID=3363994 RepID=UPI0038180066
MARTLATSPAAQQATRGKPKLGFMILLAFAIASANGAQLSNAILTLSLKSSVISSAAATTVLSIAVGVGSIFALVGYPVLGRLSDRTLSRFGRRKPYLLSGAVLILLGAAVTLAATGTAVLAAGYALTTLGAVCAIVACTALVPDQIAPEFRGSASAMLGLGAPLGAVLGLFLAQLVQPNLAAMLFLPAGVAALALVLLTFSISDRAISREERPSFSFAEFAGTFWVNPLRHQGFGWAWWSRLMIFFGVAAVNAYQAFYLIMVHHVDPATVGTSIFVATLIMTAISMIFAPIFGKLSDKAGRRKPFVLGAALVFAIGLGLVAMATTYPMFLLAVAVIGLGQGVYFAVDYALIMEVLPDQDNPAKDLGIMNLASSLPSSLVPAVAPALLLIGASATNPQNFTALFLAGAACAVVGALVVLPIKGVK